MKLTFLVGRTYLSIRSTRGTITVVTIRDHDPSEFSVTRCEHNRDQAKHNPFLLVFLRLRVCARFENFKSLLSILLNREAPSYNANDSFLHTEDLDTTFYTNYDLSNLLIYVQ